MRLKNFAKSFLWSKLRWMATKPEYCAESRCIFFQNDCSIKGMLEKRYPIGEREKIVKEFNEIAKTDRDRIKRLCMGSLIGLIEE